MTPCRPPPSPQHCPTPAGARRPRAAGHRRAGADRPRFNEPGSPVTLTLPPDARRRRRRRAGRPRGAAAGPGLADLGRRVGGQAAHPRPVRPVPPALPHPRPGPRAVRRPHVRPGRRRRSPRPSSTGCATSGPLVLLALVGARHPRALPGRPDPGHPGRGRPPRRRRSSRSRSPRTATPRPTTRSASRWSPTTPAPTRSWRCPSPRGHRGGRDLPAGGPRRSSTSTGRRPTEQGLVLFFTGLSGSGKSTLARALMDRILEHGERTVTSLDGDVVRRNLSAGLTFSKEDRETNIRRIGWVAAEISRHGGVAVCSPIAPFDETRQQVRRDGRRGRRRVLPGARRDAARGVRAPRPQGALRQGPARRDPRVHRHLLAVRGAARTPPSGSTPPAEPSRNASTR